MPYLPDNPDAAVLDLLKTFDAHPGQERKIDFYLYFSSKRKSKQAMAELECLGLSVEMIQAEKQWLCLASRVMTPRSNALAGMRRVLEDIADRLDGNYDGWETIVLEERTIAN